MGFKFELNETVRIVVSGEQGEVKGRAEYSSGCPATYLLLYKRGDGSAAEEWWNEDRLEKA